ncbi:hypothetical protein NOV91_23540 (plasmid) [Salmonella enterica subsp. enterica serovar Mbandaka]|uniref:hypothetical protein n=1 Tax=Salmonella enterica TaxID=28901 RepID=UPI00210F6908|nr:hypothetical protein [Salmonella enterica]UUC26706.1 hypothetical protein NOV91_23540 [Salmonella enterica subsp. enterica serovar Mbandaka]
MQPQPAVHDGLPGIDARTVSAVVIRLEPFAGQQLRVRDQEVQLQPPLVLVLHPQHAVLVFIESGHQNTLEARHQFFTLTGR